VIGKVVADFMVTEIVVGEMTAPVDGVARKSMVHMPVKCASGESVRTKGAAHMHRTVGREAVKAAKAMAAAEAMKAAATERRMEAAAAHMEASTSAAAHMEASTSAAGPFRHCRDIRRKAERTDRNAGCQNPYCSLHGRFLNR
jgi:hypothetical protein